MVDAVGTAGAGRGEGGRRHVGGGGGGGERRRAAAPCSLPRSGQLHADARWRRAEEARSVANSADAQWISSGAAELGGSSTARRGEDDGDWLGMSVEWIRWEEKRIRRKGKVKG